jgi:hypothetical protein
MSELRAAVVLLILSVGATAEAAPWIRSPGHSWVSLRTGTFAAEIPGTDALLRSGSEIFSAAVTAEVGLPKRFELGVDLPYSIATNHFGGERFVNRAFGDMRLYLNYGLPFETPVAVGFETKLPLYRRVVDQAQGELIEVDGQLRTVAQFPDVGDGNVDLVPSIAIGHSFYPRPAWATAKLSYRHRLGPWVDGVEAALSAGLWAYENWIGFGVYTAGLLNLGRDENVLNIRSREFFQISGYALLGTPVQGLLVKIWAGTVPWARQSESGGDFGVALSFER